MENPYELEDQLSVENEDEVIAVRVALFVTLYFENGSTEDKKRNILSCIETCSEILQDHLTYIKNPTTFAWEAITNDSQQKLGEWILANDENKEYEYGLKGGDSEDEASHFEIDGLSPASWETEPAYFRFVVPITYYADRDDRFLDTVQKLCELLEPIHGYAGLGLIESPNGTIAQEMEPVVFSMAQRFEGLEVDRPHSHSLFVETEIKSVNWITILSVPFVEKLGGIEQLRTQLASQEIIDLGKTTLIVASDRPQMGDTNRQIRVDDYRRVANVLEPIMIDSHRNFHSGLPNRFTKESSEAWLKRFLSP